MVKPFSDAVTSLKKGDVTTAPVQTQFGWHVIKLVDTRAAQVPSYDKVKDGLERTLQQRKLEKMMLGLKEKSKIDVTTVKRRTELFGKWVLLALILLVLELGLRYTIFRTIP